MGEYRRDYENMSRRFGVRWGEVRRRGESEKTRPGEGVQSSRLGRSSQAVSRSGSFVLG